MVILPFNSTVWYGICIHEMLAANRWLRKK